MIGFCGRVICYLTYAWLIRPFTEPCKEFIEGLKERLDRSSPDQSSRLETFFGIGSTG